MKTTGQLLLESANECTGIVHETLKFLSLFDLGEKVGIAMIIAMLVLEVATVCMKFSFTNVDLEPYSIVGLIGISICELIAIMSFDNVAMGGYTWLFIIAVVAQAVLSIFVFSYYLDEEIGIIFGHFIFLLLAAILIVAIIAIGLSPFINLTFWIFIGIHIIAMIIAIFGGYYTYAFSSGIVYLPPLLLVAAISIWVTILFACFYGILFVVSGMGKV